MSTNGVPPGYHSLQPYLPVADVRAQLAFLQEGLGGVVTEKIELKDGTIQHAEIRVGDSIVMVGQARGQWKPMPCCIYHYVADVDHAFARAVSAGATSIVAPQDQFYGDRSGGLIDPNGNQWWLASRQLTLPPDELDRRAQLRADSHP